MDAHELQRPAKGRAAADDLSRAWTLLLRVYNEVAETGRWLLRRDPNGKDEFPSLYSVARPGGGRPRKRPAGTSEPKPPTRTDG
jgi:hypothetical protein